MRGKTHNSKYIEITEGQLSYVPPIRKKHTPQKFKRKSCTNRPTGVKKAKLEQTAPGWVDWRGRQRAEDIKLMPKGTVGRIPGNPNGIRKDEMAARRKSIKEQLGSVSVEAIRARIEMEDCPINEAIMKFYAEIFLEENNPLRERMSAMRDLLPYLKAKPAIKQDIKVSEADEAWNEEISEDGLTSRKDTWSPKLN